jgi:hypothetical protein
MAYEPSQRTASSVRSLPRMTGVYYRFRDTSRESSVFRKPQNVNRRHFCASAQSSAVLVIGTSGISEHEQHSIDHEHDLAHNYTGDK